MPSRWGNQQKAVHVYAVLPLPFATLFSYSLPIKAQFVHFEVY